MEENMTVVCPACGGQTEQAPIDRVNTTLQPEARQQILDGTFFRLICPHCGREIPWVTPCLYHDMQRRQMIALVPPGEETLQKGSLEPFAGRDPLEQYTLRRVSTPEEMAEKICLWDAGRQDTLTELYKVLLWAQVRQQRPDFTVAAIVYERKAGQETFLLSSVDGQRLTTAFSQQTYEEVERRFAPCDPGQEDFPQVNFSWALRQQPR